MAKAWRFWVLLSLAGIGLIVLFGSVMLVESNFQLQARLDEGARWVSAGRRLQPLHEELVQSLAALSARHPDPQLSRLLEEYGVRTNPAGASAARSAP